MQHQGPCEVCGATDGVVSVMAYVGGHGHEPRRRCAELIACWARWDQQHEEKESRSTAGTRRAA
jgi:hypothetical protein